MKPIIITAANNKGNINRFLESFKKVDNAELQIISFAPEIKNSYIYYNTDYPGHVKKYQYLKKAIQYERWYIYVDMFDVIFQKNIPELTKFNHDVIVSSEKHLWCQSQFYSKILAKDKRLSILYDKPVYCSGTFAMKGYNFIELIDFFRDIDTAFNQPYFNLWVHSKKHTNSDELFCTLFKGIDLGYITKSEGVFYNSGKISSIVHGNGSYDKYL